MIYHISIIVGLLLFNYKVSRVIIMNSIFSKGIFMSMISVTGFVALFFV